MGDERGTKAEPTVGASGSRRQTMAQADHAPALPAKASV
jgi:hypothetical protein